MKNNHRMRACQSWLVMMSWALSLALPGGVLAQSGNPFALTEPTYNCTTGAITFNTAGGDGTSIEFMAPGITGWTSNPNQILDACARTCADIPPFMITARQSGKLVSYTWSRQTYCANATPIVRVTPISDMTVAVGQGVNFVIGGSFSSSLTANWSVDAQGLPPGISSFFRQEGGGSPIPTWVLVGTPTTAGIYSVTATARANGGSASTTFKYIVTNGSNPLTLTAPTYNCTTGAITFNTAGGDGTSIEFMAPGITGWTSNPNQILDACARTCADIPPFMITARQSGKLVSYTWSRQTYCANAALVRVRPIPDRTVVVGQGDNFPIGASFSTSVLTTWSVGAGVLPPGIQSVFRQEGPGSTNPTWELVGTFTTAGVYSVTASAYANANGGSASTTFKYIVTNGSNPLTLTAPTYNCTTGAITFNTAGGDGTPIEFMAIGITGWSTNPNQFVDKESRTVNDVMPFMLMARQSGQVVTLSWDLKAACGRARVGVEASNGPLSLRVLGNPAHEQLRVLLEGAQGQSVQLQLTDAGGRLLENRTIESAGEKEEQSFRLDQYSPGLLLLQATTNTKIGKVKVIKQ